MRHARVLQSCATPLEVFLPLQDLSHRRPYEALMLLQPKANAAAGFTTSHPASGLLDISNQAFSETPAVAGSSDCDADVRHITGAASLPQATPLTSGAAGANRAAGLSPLEPSEACLVSESQADRPIASSCNTAKYSAEHQSASAVMSAVSAAQEGTRKGQSLPLGIISTASVPKSSPDAVQLGHMHLSIKDRSASAVYGRALAPETASIPDGLVMVAVPGDHSRKPQLAQLLMPYLPDEPRCLEVRTYIVMTIQP